MKKSLPDDAYYDRPAVLSLLPEVAGKRILDAGCGPGFYSEILAERDADITGLDANQRMLEHYRNRMGDRASAIRANMDEPLDMFGDCDFDGIISPLAVAYVKDHRKIFAEFSRILKPGGWFVFSTEHPFFSYGYFGIENYFETQQVEAEWKGFSEPITVPSYYRSLGSLFKSLSSSGFVVEALLEPKQTEEFRRADPVRYRRLMEFPLFLCLRAAKTGQLPR